MEKIKFYIILSVAVLSLIVVAFILFSITGGNPQEVDELIQTGDQSSVRSESSSLEEEPAESASINISGFAYSPAAVKVKKGATVTWTNQDSTGHDITPDNATGWFQQSSLLGKGETFTVIFEETGTFTYHCSPHPHMKGTIEVV